MFTDNLLISKFMYQKPQTGGGSTTDEVKTYHPVIEERIRKWRDDIARFEDESHEYVLPSKLLDKIVAESGTFTSPDMLLDLSKATLNDYVPLYLA